MQKIKRMPKFLFKFKFKSKLKLEPKFKSKFKFLKYRATSSFRPSLPPKL